MSVETTEQDRIEERRAYPRFKAQCAVHYFTIDGKTWLEAVLEDYSAGGVCFHCDETLFQDTKITIQIRRDNRQSVPAIAASAVVVRCDIDDDHRYRVACKFTRVRDEGSRKFEFLRR
jgi:hypothetical protein